ncbi:MAG: S41 family peptidase [Bacteroidota bacterium]
MTKIITFIFLIALAGPAYSQMKEIDSPVENFEKLWQKFNLRYANFNLKKVDWDEIYKKYRPLVDDETVNEELFNICCLMLQELNDGHVTITPNFTEEAIECGPPYEFNLTKEFETADEFEQFESILRQELVQNGFSKPIACKVTEETNFQYSISDSFGYLRLDEMTEENTFGRFNRALNEALSAFQNKQGIIIDLRFNGGGWDYIAYKLAGRLISGDQEVGHYERTRIKGTDQYTDKKYRKIKPKGKFQFAQSIVVLTSDYTASASEVFLLLMKDLPYVTIVGDHSEGIFSDVYEFKLPNKWEIGLSHQQFFSMDSTNYEGEGILPDIQVVNIKTDIKNKRDPVIRAAIGHLLEK